MNASQVKYIRERAIKIKRSRIAALEDAHKASLFDDKGIRNALKAGEFTVKSRGSGWSIRDYISFIGETPRDDAAIRRGTEAIEKAYDVLMDKAMLGDVEGAVAALQAFEAGE